MTEPTKTATRTRPATNPPPPAKGEAKQEIIETPPKTAGTAVMPAKLDPAMVGLARQVDEVATSYAVALEQASGHMERAFLMASAITQIDKALTVEVMKPIMTLMGDPNGFKTDRDNPKNGAPRGYPIEVVKKVMITALLNRVFPVGNEVNIIAEQCYITLNGWIRKFREIPGISNISESPGAPVFKEGSPVLVRVAISWNLHGKHNELTDGEGKPGRVFAINTRGNESPDNLIGKARRKAYKAAYEKATGSVITADDGDLDDDLDDDVEGRMRARAAISGNAKPKAEQLLNQLQSEGHLRAGAGGGTATPAPAATPTGIRPGERIRDALQVANYQAADWNLLADELGISRKLADATGEQADRVIARIEELQRLAAEEAGDEQAGM